MTVRVFAEVDLKVTISPPRLGTQVAIAGFVRRARARGRKWPARQLDDPFMIATVPLAERLETSRSSLFYLLLGDLRSLLEEPPGALRDRWLVATLDMLLVSRPRSVSSIYLPTFSNERPRVETASRFAAVGPIPFDSLQRLRDRIVHRAPSDVLIHELQADLSEWSQTMKLLATVSSIPA